MLTNAGIVGEMSGSWTDLSIILNFWKSFISLDILYMIDKETQLDFSENIQEVIYKAHKVEKDRKISVPVIPTAFCFNIESGVRPGSRYSRCSSRKEIRTNMKRNNSEYRIRPKMDKVPSVINLSFNQNMTNRARKIKKNSNNISINLGRFCCFLGFLIWTLGIFKDF